MVECRSHRKYLRWDLRCAWIIVNTVVRFTVRFTIIQANCKSHRKHLRWFLRCAFIIVNIGVKFTIIFKIIHAERKSYRKYLRFTLCMRYRKYLRWDLRSACIIVKIYAPKNVICFTQIFSFMDPYSINSFFVQCFFTSLVFYGMNVSTWRRQVCKFQIIRLYIHRSADKILESTSRCEQTQVREGVQKIYF